MFASRFRSSPSLLYGHARRLSSAPNTGRRVWVLTDGGIQSTLSGLALGKRLGHVELKTVVASKALEMFPPIVQKYLVDWFIKRKRDDDDKVPWYLALKEGGWGGPKPDFAICSAHDSTPACLTLSKSSPTTFSVYVGYPNIPFIHFDQVVLPKYEMEGRLAKLGPFYSKQKNCIATEVPLLDLDKGDERHLKQILPSSFDHAAHKLTAVVIGGHVPECRWYSEDANALADNMQRMVKKLHAKIVVVFTERTSEEVKKKIRHMQSQHADAIGLWDAMADTQGSLARAETYQSIIDKASRVVVTADLDYAVAHAAAKRKPVYVVFGDRCRQHLLRFHRWARDSRITRKLRLDRGRGAATREHADPYSYLGNQAVWANGYHVVKNEPALDHVQHEVIELRQERVTGKRRKDEQAV